MALVSEKFLSIIIPAYNSEDYIKKTLKSLSNQSSKNFEVIVIDDGSLDNTCEISEIFLEEEKIDHKVIRCEKNRGQSTARNIGLDYSKGRYILFLDSDDFVLENLVEVLEKSTLKEPDILLFDYKRVRDYKIRENKKEQEFDELNLIKGEEVFKSYKSNKIRLWTGSLIYKKEFLEENNLRLLEGAYAAEDLNFIFKALLSSNKVMGIKKSLSFYCEREGSLTKSPNIYKNMTLIDSMEDVSLFIEKNNLPVDLKEYIDKEFISEHIMYQILGYLKSGREEEVLSILNDKRVKKYLKGAKIKSDRYGRSLAFYIKMAAYFPRLFINTYLKRTGK